MKLSILVPVYNELDTVQHALDRILAVDYPCDLELVIVDDGSTDGTGELLEKLTTTSASGGTDAATAETTDRGIRVTLRRHPTNRGKGAAIRTAADLATGDYLTICDADLEYEPAEIPSLLQPVSNGEAEVVYGTRRFSSHTSYSYWYVLGNKAVTTAANILFNCYISDLETCFKLMPKALYQQLAVQSSGFGMEAEITGKLLHRGIRPYEVPISYVARSRGQGKKLTWWDGVEALWLLTRIRLTGR